jgi:AcrR family transcriptional regulator
MRVTPETKHATRKRILEVANEQFARQGFEATTTRDIARAARIAAGTLFNYFPTKEAIVESLVGEAYAGVAEAFAAATNRAEPPTLEEELFAHVAAVLRKLRPYRNYLPAVLETSLSPLVSDQVGPQPSPRVAHLETVVQIVSRHGHQEALSALAVQLYWTLYTGVLGFWAKDASPRQEDTLALLDQSLAMFVGWLTSQGNQETPPRNEG